MARGILLCVISIGVACAHMTLTYYGDLFFAFLIGAAVFLPYRDMLLVLGSGGAILSLTSPTFGLSWALYAMVSIAARQAVHSFLNSDDMHSFFLLSMGGYACFSILYWVLYHSIVVVRTLQIAPYFEPFSWLMRAYGEQLAFSALMYLVFRVFKRQMRGTFQLL